MDINQFCEVEGPEHVDFGRRVAKFASSIIGKPVPQYTETPVGTICWYIGKACSDEEKECTNSSRQMQSFKEHLPGGCRRDTSVLRLTQEPSKSSTIRFPTKTEGYIRGEMLDLYRRRTFRDVKTEYWTFTSSGFKFHIHSLNINDPTGHCEGSYLHLYFVASSDDVIEKVGPCGNE